jgi:hypothetical protein
MRLYVPRFGAVRKTGDFCMLFSEKPNMSDMEWAMDPKNPSKFIVKSKED